VKYTWDFSWESLKKEELEEEGLYKIIKLFTA
jgi:hypothetical protein